MNDRDLLSSLLQSMLQSLLETFSLWPVALLTIVIVCIALIGFPILLTKTYASTYLTHATSPSLSQPSDFSLLSPTLAVELLEPNSAQAWLLSVTLDLTVAQHHHTLSPFTARRLRDLNRATRRLLIAELRRAEPDDARILPITHALLDLAHALPHRPQDVPSARRTLERALAEHAHQQPPPTTAPKE